MKQILSLVLAVAVALALAACGAVADFNTPKSEALAAQYDFYTDSQRSLASGMAITPEQADDVFLVLVSCGMEKAVSNVNRKAGDGGHCAVWSGSAIFDVYYSDGKVDRVERAGKELYPNPAPAEEAPEPAPTEPAETLPPEDEAPATLEEAVNAAAESARADVTDLAISDGVVQVSIAGKDNLSSSLIRGGMLLQGYDILKALQGRDDLSEIVMRWTFPLLDAYGNSFEDVVMKIDITRATLEKINFDNFAFENLPGVADEYYQHAALN